MRDLPTVVISDLDSTLCLTEQRHALANESLMSGDWDKYSLECINDDVNYGTLATLRLLYPHHQIHLVSGRSEVARDNTEAWLRDFEVKYDALKLFDYKRWGHTATNWDIKVDYIENLRSLGYAPVLFLEDWPPTAEAIEKVGVPVLCVNPRYKSGPLSTHL